MSPDNRAAVLHGIADLRIEQRPVPEPGPQEVLVEIRAVGVCGSDVHYYHHGRIGRFVLQAPMVLGHEPSGVVVGVGAEARRHRIGTRVALEPGIPCGRCEQCRAGRYNLCPDVRFFATPPIDGAFAEYVSIHEDFAHPVPGSMSFDAAALLEPLSVGIWACRKGQVTGGVDVLVTGAGPIGLCAAQAARAFGAGTVTVADLNPRRLALAAELGASATVDLGAGPLAAAGGGYDVLLECSGAQAAVREGIGVLRPAGRAVLVGMGQDEVTLPVSTLQGRELVLTGTFRYANTYPTAIALVTGGQVSLDPLVTDHFGLADAEAAVLAGRTRPEAVKVVVTP